MLSPPKPCQKNTQPKNTAPRDQKMKQTNGHQKTKRHQIHIQQSVRHLGWCCGYRALLIVIVTKTTNKISYFDAYQSINYRPCRTSYRRSSMLQYHASYSIFYMLPRVEPCLLRSPCLCDAEVGHAGRQEAEVLRDVHVRRDNFCCCRCCRY